MKDFTIEYDEKTHSFHVDNSNLVKDLAKEFAAALDIKPFQVAVQIAFDKNVSIPDAEPIKKGALAAANDLAKKVRDEITELHVRLLKLKKEEESGNKKAADAADKQVKAAKKNLDKLSGEYGGKVREAVEARYKQETGEKVKSRSASRTVFRGLELNEDFFQEKVEAEEDAPPQFDKLAKSLASAGKDLAALTGDEKKLRAELAGQITDLQQTIDKQRGDKRDFDIQEFAKKNSKDTSSLSAAADKYADFIAGMDKQLYAAVDEVSKLKKLADKSKSLSDDKELADELEAYHDALSRIKDNVNDKLEAAEKAQRLLKDDYKQGAAWKSLAVELTTMKGAAKSGKALEDSGKALQKMAKA